MAQTNVRELFDLQAQEQIYDDFACKEGALNNGSLYLTENYLCFFRNLIGFQKKIKIMWTDVKNLEIKNKEFKVHSNKEKDSPLTFSGFSDFATSSKYVIRLWNAARGIDSDDDDETETPGQSQQSVEVPKPVQSPAEAASLQPVPQSQADSQKQVSQIESEPEQKFEFSSELKSDVAAADVVEKTSEPRTREGSSHDEKSDTSAGTGGKGGESITPEQAMQLVREHVEAANGAAAPADQPDYTTKDELVKLLSKLPVAANHTVINESFLQLSVTEFFRKIL